MMGLYLFFSDNLSLYQEATFVVTLAASSGKRNVTMYGVRPSVCPAGIHTVTHQPVASVHFGQTIRRTIRLLGKYRWRSGATGRALDLRSTGRGFKS